jgi:phospholipid/cholesterol/gamma-HCH transport system ATP-binding protein
MSVPVLSCENLRYCEDDTCLLDEVSFRLEPGQRGVVLAEPHRLATILLKICASLIPPTSGEISWFGRSGGEEVDSQEIYQLRRRIGIVHRETALISNMTILDNVSLGLQYHDEIALEQAYDRVTEALKQFELYEYRFSRPAELTFEQRRLAVYARELVKNPQLYLLEHPSLDLGERVYGLLLEIFRTCSIELGCGFLVASVKPQVVERWGDWVLVLDEGQCQQFEADQFDHSLYRESMRRRSPTVSKEWRDE